jgi:hypothetical protein
MSSTTLTRSLSERVGAIRVRQSNRSVPDRLPPAAGRSLLVEVLLAEFAAAMPEPLAARLRAADSPGTAIDLMFAAAVYRAVAGDPHLTRTFLTMVGSNPRAAGVALATALASKQEPPTRDTGWHRRDWAGLVLQLVAACLVLLFRCLLVVVAAAVLRPIEATAILRSRLPDLIGPELFSGIPTGDLPASVILALAAVWLGLEAVAAPRLFESLRQLPARRRGLPPPLAWRADAFHVVWYVQASGALLLVDAGLFVLLRRMAILETASVIRWSAIAGLGLAAAVALGLVLGLARSTLRLGTGKM